ncbi:MAG: 4'-phosphopantetheinyl transferase family protein [Burkholderiaceae bacterium]
MSAWLWLADLAPADDPRWQRDALALLSASEYARLARLARRRRRAQFLCAHVLLRHLLSTRADVSAAHVTVVSSVAGVTVAAPAGWSASIAHSGDWVAAAVDERGAPLGVDLENMHARRDIEAIVAAACGVSVSSPIEAYRWWTQREAEFKAGAPAARTWTATWGALALALCGQTPPQAQRFDWARARPTRLKLVWTAAAPLDALL